MWVMQGCFDEPIRANSFRYDTAGVQKLLHCPRGSNAQLAKLVKYPRYNGLSNSDKFTLFAKKVAVLIEGECYSQKTATFLLMGQTCTRACAFCQVDKGHAPMALDPKEPQKVAEAVKLLGLRYVVLTSVARDDLPDGGAGWFVKVMAAIRHLNPETKIEVLTPDFFSGRDCRS